MTLYRLLHRSLRRGATTASTAQTLSLYHHQPRLQNPSLLIPTRSFAFTTAEEAAAERRRMKRRLRIEPPMHALRNSGPPPQRDPNAPKLPDSTSSLVGPRLNLHNRVQSLIRADDLDAASVLARQSCFSNTRPTVFTCNAIIAAMYRASRYSDAIALFHYFFRQFNIIPNVVSYNMLIVTHCEMGNVDEGLKNYQHILENAPFSPSPVTYRHLTKGLIDAGRITEAVDLLREMLNKGHGADSLVYNNLIAGFLKLENLAKANELFDELKERCLVYDGVVNATFMDWFFNNGREKEAMESYKSLLDRQFRMVPATCNVLLEVLLKHGRKTEAWALFDNMLDNHTPPTFQAVNSDTFNIMVNETINMGKISEAYDVFKRAGKAAKSKPFAMDVAGYSNMISKYCEHEMMEEAEKTFAELCGKSLNPDVKTYRTLIDAYVKLNRVDDALQKYTKMVEAGLRVIPLYANRWFSFLIEKGRTVECVPILTKMCERDPKPDATTYDFLIRAACEEGKFDLSLDLVGQMARFSVGVPPVLREFVLEAFGKEGRRQDVEKLLFARYPGYAAHPPPSGPPRMANPLRGPPQVAGQVSGPSRTTSLAGYPRAETRVTGPPPQGQVFHPSQMERQVAGPPSSASQISGYPHAGFQVAGSPQGQAFGTAFSVPKPPVEFQTAVTPQTPAHESGTSRTPFQGSGNSGSTFQESGHLQMNGQTSGATQTAQFSGYPCAGFQVAGSPRGQAFGTAFSVPKPPIEFQTAVTPQTPAHESGTSRTPFQGSGNSGSTFQESGHLQMNGQTSGATQTAQFSGYPRAGFQVAGSPQGQAFGTAFSVPKPPIEFQTAVTAQTPAHESGISRTQFQGSGNSGSTFQGSGNSPSTFKESGHLQMNGQTSGATQTAQFLSCIPQMEGQVSSPHQVSSQVSNDPQVAGYRQG